MQGYLTLLYENCNYDVVSFRPSDQCFPAGSIVLCKEGWGDSHSQSWRSTGLKHDNII